MVGLIIATHGNFSQAILESAEMIVGKQKNIETITFLEGQSLEDLALNYDKAIEKLSPCENIYLLVDILGGTPFNVGINYQDDFDEIITGVNLPLLLELLILRESSVISNNLSSILANAKEGINLASNILTDNDDEDF